MRSVLFLLGTLVLSAAWTLEPPQVADWGSVDAIFAAKCTSCHGEQEAARGLRLDGWERVFAGSDHGEAVIPFDSNNSLLVELAEKHRAGSHPEELGEKALSEQEVGTIRAWIEAGAAGPDGQIPFDDDGPRLYVANQGSASVSIIDMISNQVVRTVDLTELGFSPGCMPHHIAVEPDGSFWYLSLIVDDKVLKFNRDNELVAQADVVKPGLVSIDPEGPWLYAARSMMSVSPPESMVQIDRRDMSVEVVELLIPRPHALATSGDGGRVYVSSLGMNRVVTYEPEAGEMHFADVEGDMTHVFIGFAISPDGTTMVGTAEVSPNAFLFDIREGGRAVLRDTVGVLRAPWHPVYNPNGKEVYFGNNWTNTITVLDVESRSVSHVIEGVHGIAQPHGSAISPDGRFLYISNRNLRMPAGHSKETHVYNPRYELTDNANIGTVLVIDTETREVVKVIETERYSSGMGAAPVTGGR